MTDQQQLALEQLPGIALVGAAASDLIVRLDRRLFVLSPSGLLRKFA